MFHPQHKSLLPHTKRKIFLDQRTINAGLGIQVPLERIKEIFTKVDLSVSSYDTAWIAMVPSLNSSQIPCFPESVNWLLENQLCNGSWGPHSHPLLIKDALSSTLACVLALKRWNVGEEHWNKGLHFIGSNFASATDAKQQSPIGFDIIFPGMIEYAADLGLNLHLNPTAIDAMLHKRDLELKRDLGRNFEGRKAYLAYVAEGMGKQNDWEEVMKYQRKNGSLFNSPSTTAAALTHLQDVKCFQYLQSLLERFGNAVPTVYPIDVYTRLCMVDSLERLGIARHFRSEIENVMDETYRRWLQRDEQIFLDTATLAMAFRLLRMNGFEISSDELAHLIEEDIFFKSVEGYRQDVGTVLELYKASQIMTSPNETVLEKINSWSSHFPKEELHKAEMYGDKFHKEVEYALKFPSYANLERLENRENINHHNVDNVRILKTSYRCFNVDNSDFLELAEEDFNICQSIHHNELKDLEKWFQEKKLDQLKFARQRLTFCYFSAAATIFSPELSDARIYWAKNAVLTTVVDDFFDTGNSEEDLVNLINLVEKWDENSDTNYCSKQVQIIFSALCNTINETEGKAFKRQDRSVKNHLLEIWLALLKSMMREAEWVRNKCLPTIDEYLENGFVSLAIEPTIVTALYLVGPKISEDVIKGQEYHDLYKLTSTCGRLLNDIQTFKRECKEGKLNSVALHIIQSSGAATEDDAVREIRNVIECKRRELLNLVLQRRGSVVPRSCKELFWKMSKVLHIVYMKTDGYTSLQEMADAVNAVIYEPLNPTFTTSNF